jgi:hypothetical protein
VKKWIKRNDGYFGGFIDKYSFEKVALVDSEYYQFKMGKVKALKAGCRWRHRKSEVPVLEMG